MFSPGLSARPVEEQIGLLGERINVLAQQEQAYRNRHASARGFQEPMATTESLGKRLSALATESENARKRNAELDRFCGEWRSWLRGSFQGSSEHVAWRRQTYLETAESLMPLWSEVSNRETQAAVAQTREQIEAVKQQKQEAAKHLMESRRLEKELHSLQQELREQQQGFPSLVRELARDVLKQKPEAPTVPNPALAQDSLFGMAGMSGASSPQDVGMMHGSAVSPQTPGTQTMQCGHPASMVPPLNNNNLVQPAANASWPPFYGWPGGGWPCPPMPWNMGPWGPYAGQPFLHPSAMPTVHQSAASHVPSTPGVVVVQPDLGKQTVSSAPQTVNSSGNTTAQPSPMVAAIQPSPLAPSQTPQSMHVMIAVPSDGVPISPAAQAGTPLHAMGLAAAGMPPMSVVPLVPTAVAAAVHPGTLPESPANHSQQLHIIQGVPQTQSTAVSPTALQVSLPSQAPTSPALSQGRSAAASIQAGNAHHHEALPSTDAITEYGLSVSGAPSSVAFDADHMSEVNARRARRLQRDLDYDEYDEPSHLGSRGSLDQPQARPRGAQAKEQARAKAKPFTGALGSRQRRGSTSKHSVDLDSLEESSVSMSMSLEGDRPPFSHRGQQSGLSSYKQRQQAMAGNGSGSGMSAYKMKQQAAANSTSSGAGIRGRASAGLGGRGGGGSLLSNLKSNPSWVATAGAESGDEIVDHNDL